MNRSSSFINQSMGVLDLAYPAGRTTAEDMNSPIDSQKTVSDDDEIDYSAKPELYDPSADDKDELWVHKKTKGSINSSDAVLSCPACFTTLCHESQRHEKYVTQYRAIFAFNCEIASERVAPPHLQRRESETEVKQVRCSVCSTEVGVFDQDHIFHFFNVLPSES